MVRFISQKTTHGSLVPVRIILAPIAQLATFQTFLKVTLLTMMDHIMVLLWAVKLYTLPLTPFFCILYRECSSFPQKRILVS